MSDHHNIFSIEDRIDALFDTVYPRLENVTHPSGRALKYIINSSLGSLVPGEDRRLLQRRREYFKVDFQDFLDYATSSLPAAPTLGDFPDQTALFYEPVNSVGDLREVDATWTVADRQVGLSILDVAIARDRPFVTVFVRFAGLSFLRESDEPKGTHRRGKVIQLEKNRIAEKGITIIFFPAKGIDINTCPLEEWERVTWMPPASDNDEYTFAVSGEYTNYLLDEMEKNPSQSDFSPQVITSLRAHPDINFKKNGVFFEVARLGLHLPSYVKFMYDLVVTEKVRAGTRKRRRTDGSGRKSATTVARPVYKVIRSIRIIHPDSGGEVHQERRQWTAPSYSFVVHGHWRRLKDGDRKGQDSAGTTVDGKTWVKDYKKYKDRGDLEFEPESAKRDPEVVIGIKQTLAYARDVIKSHERSALETSTDSSEGSPSTEWMANERAKLTAGLRYLILQRDGFRCRLCGKSAGDENFVKLEVDHVHPVSKWGRTVQENLQTVCRYCNRGKSDI